MKDSDAEVDSIGVKESLGKALYAGNPGYGESERDRWQLLHPSCLQVSRSEGLVQVKDAKSHEGVFQMRLRDKAQVECLNIQSKVEGVEH